MLVNQLVVLGDSITEYSTRFPNGFARTLADHYARKLDLTIRGYSGYTSHMLKLAYSEIVESLGIAEVAGAVLFIGTNDSVKPGEDQYIPIDECEENITWLVEELFKVTSTVVVVTPTIVDETRAPQHSDALAAEYAERIARAGRKAGAEVVELRKHFGQNYDLLYDGLHFNDDGYKIASDAIIDGLENAGLRADDIPLSLPLWRELIGKRRL